MGVFPPGAHPLPVSLSPHKCPQELLAALLPGFRFPRGRRSETRRSIEMDVMLDNNSPATYRDRHTWRKSLFLIIATAMVRSRWQQGFTGDGVALFGCMKPPFRPSAMPATEKASVMPSAGEGMVACPRLRSPGAPSAYRYRRRRWLRGWGVKGKLGLSQEMTTSLLLCVVCVCPFMSIPDVHTYVHEQAVRSEELGETATSHKPQ